MALHLPLPYIATTLPPLRRLRSGAEIQGSKRASLQPTTSLAGGLVLGSLICRAQRSRTPQAVARTGKDLPQNPAGMKVELLDILSGESWDASRVEAAQRVEDLVEALIEAYQQMEMKNDEAQKLLEGKWQLLSTFTPGQAAANLFSLKSWQEYVFGKGPSPVQAAAFTNNAVQRVYQVLDLSVSPKRWYNIIDATPNGIICLEADLTSQAADVKFQWTGGQIVINRPPWSQQDLDQPIRLPYPVPFALLGDRARGIFETVYLDDDLRISSS